MVIRTAAPEDAAGILAIYRPIVQETVISFELESPSLAEMEGRIAATMAVAPWLVTEAAGRIVGYAYAGPHRTREAYQWSVESSVFVAPDVRRSGVGRGLYAALMPLLGRMGFRRCFAGIALPNAASVALHEAMGFEPVGVFRRVGHKLGAWHDVGWWQRDLGSDLDGRDPADRDPLAPPIRLERVGEGRDLYGWPVAELEAWLGGITG